MNGHLASGFIINFLQNYFGKLDFNKEINYYINNPEINQIMSKNDIKEKIIYDNLTESNYRLIKAGFIKCENQLTQTNFDVNFSGSTAVLLIMLSKL